ncbi:GGDEF domain-containing protein [Streptomyces sp. NPDC056160]|uniref:GGDEF domain-containing protein n=1 Tax=Streptomyces sp. NPDC056160 TaxID=3345731 RepID=UPI0035E002DB
MPSSALLRQPPRTLVIAATALPLALAVLADDVRLRRRLEAAHRDPLTGLLRRDAYTARARRLLGRHDETAVVMVDADRFKQINDSAGHAAGDAVLAAFGARLTVWAGPHAAVGRLGGDEFSVALELPASSREQRLAHLVQMLHAPVVLDDGRSIDVAASVGAATPDVIGTRDLTLLQRAADAALYDGKHTGRARLATTAHTAVPSVNDRRAGRPGTALRERAA